MKALRLAAVAAAAAGAAALHLPADDLWQMVGVGAAGAMLVTGTFQALRPRPVWGLVSLALLTMAAVVPATSQRLLPLPPAASGALIAIGYLGLTSSFHLDAGRFSVRALAASMAWAAAPFALVAALLAFGPTRLTALAERDLAYPLLGAAIVLATAASFAALRPEESP